MAHTAITWQQVSRALGVAIIVALLVSFLIESFQHREIDTAVVLAFLGIASGLIGLPSGYQLIKRGSEQQNGSSSSRHGR